MSKFQKVFEKYITEAGNSVERTITGPNGKKVSFIVEVKGGKSVVVRPLDLSDMGLTSIPKEISGISEIKKLLLNNNDLKSLSGIPKKTTTLVLSNNKNLGSLKGLSGRHDTLTCNNCGLKTLAGMPAVSVHLDLRDNPELKSLKGLNIPTKVLKSKNQFDMFRGKIKLDGTGISAEEAENYLDSVSTSAAVTS